MGRINLLHVSDLHIAKNPKLPALKETSYEDYIKRLWEHETLASYDPGILRALTKFIGKRQNELHAVIVTGDISTSGLDHDLRLASKVIEKFNNHRQTFILPGNHDRYQNMFDGINLVFKPGGKRFHYHFGKYWNDDVRENQELTDGNLTVCVISADFSLRRIGDSKVYVPGGFYAQGYVYRDILDELKEATDNVSAKFGSTTQVAVIWALHFPPVAFGIAAHSELVGANELIKAAKDKEILALISGHSHYKIKESKDELFFLGAGSATQVDGKGNHIQIITIDNDNGFLLISEEDFIYNQRQGRFVKYGQRF